MVVSNIFYVHPNLGKIPILTNMFQMGWNHQLENDALEKNIFPVKRTFHRPPQMVCYRGSIHHFFWLLIGTPWKVLVYGDFLKCWYPTTMGFPTQDHLEVFWGYHHLRKHPYMFACNTLPGHCYGSLLPHLIFVAGLMVDRLPGR